MLGGGIGRAVAPRSHVCGGSKPQAKHPTAEHRARPIQAHIDDFIASLEAAGRTEKHIEVSRARLERLKDGCNLKTIDDLDPERIATKLREWMNDKTLGIDKTGLGAATANHLIRQIKSLELFLLNRGRIGRKRLGVLQPFSNPTPKRRRRALTAAEQARLIETTRASTVKRCHYDGPARARIYLLALATGLRAGELAQLRAEDFNRSDIDGRLYLAARAATTKARNIRWWRLLVPTFRLASSNARTPARFDWLSLGFNHHRGGI